jgi:hypothetical protein
MLRSLRSLFVKRKPRLRVITECPRLTNTPEHVRFLHGALRAARNRSCEVSRELRVTRDELAKERIRGAVNEDLQRTFADRAEDWKRYAEELENRLRWSQERERILTDALEQRVRVLLPCPLKDGQVNFVFQPILPPG